MSAQRAQLKCMFDFIIYAGIHPQQLKMGRERFSALLKDTLVRFMNVEGIKSGTFQVREFD